MATHEELMTSLKFDESFRNALRDYYSYGFKRFKDYENGKVQTLKNDWDRLNNILHDYLEWPEGRGGKNEVLFATQDSLAMAENPFHRLYRFCKFNHNDPMAFFNIIFALSDKINIAGDNSTKLYERLGIDLYTEAKKRPYYRYIEFIKKNQNNDIIFKTLEPPYSLIASGEDGSQHTVIEEADIEIVREFQRVWEITVSENKTSGVTIIEEKFYEKLLQIMNIELLDDSVLHICRIYFDFFYSNSDKNIEIKKNKSHYKLIIVNEEHSSMAFPRKYLPLIKRMLELKDSIVTKYVSEIECRHQLYTELGWKFLKIVLERNYKKYIDFLKKNTDKIISIDRKDKKGYQLCVEGEAQFLRIDESAFEMIETLHSVWE